MNRGAAVPPQSMGFTPGDLTPARLESGYSPGPAMLYPELFKQLEAVRWNMETDIPWHSHDARQLSPEQAQTIKMNAITEWAALPATEMFLRDNREDSDFSAFMSVWFFEEQKHSLVLMECWSASSPTWCPPKPSCTPCASNSTPRRRWKR